MAKDWSAEQVDYVQECKTLEKRVADLEQLNTALENQLRYTTRTIDVLVAVGKLKQGHVEEAREIVSSLSD